MYICVNVNIYIQLRRYSTVQREAIKAKRRSVAKDKKSKKRVSKKNNTRDQGDNSIELTSMNIKVTIYIYIYKNTNSPNYPDNPDNPYNKSRIVRTDVLMSVYMNMDMYTDNQVGKAEDDSDSDVCDIYNNNINSRFVYKK